MKLITTIKADGTVSAETRKAADLEFLQKQVGGYIEMVPHFKSFNGRRCEAYCNDSGRIDGLPLNLLATDKWHAVQNLIHDPLCGDVVIIQRAARKESSNV